MAVINGLYIQRKAQITVFMLAKMCDKSAICAVWIIYTILVLQDFCGSTAPCHKVFPGTCILVAPCIWLECFDRFSKSLSESFFLSLIFLLQAKFKTKNFGALSAYLWLCFIVTCTAVLLAPKCWHTLLKISHHLLLDQQA